MHVVELLLCIASKLFVCWSCRLPKLRSPGRLEVAVIVLWWNVNGLRMVLLQSLAYGVVSTVGDRLKRFYFSSLWIFVCWAWDTLQGMVQPVSFSSLAAMYFGRHCRCLAGTEEKPLLHLEMQKHQVVRPQMYRWPRSRCQVPEDLQLPCPWMPSPCRSMSKYSECILPMEVSTSLASPGIIFSIGFQIALFGTRAK